MHSLPDGLMAVIYIFVPSSCEIYTSFCLVKNMEKLFLWIFNRISLLFGCHWKFVQNWIEYFRATSGQHILIDAINALGIEA